MNDELQMEINRQKWIKEQQAKTGKPKTSGFSASKAITVVVLILFCIVMWSVVRSMNNAVPPMAKDSTPPASSTSSAILSEHDEAQEHAKNFILKTLKAPDSAKFPPHSEIKAVKVNGMWEVSTYVDAQNSFGAMIRTPYFLKMENQGALWRLAYIGQEREKAFVPADSEPQTRPAPESEIRRSVDKDGNPVFSNQ